MLPSHFGELNLGLFVLVLVLALLLTLFFFINFNAKKRACSIPGLEPRDSVKGNLDDMMDVGSLHEFLVQLHDDYGPLASFWWGETFVVSFGSPELFSEIKDVFDRPRVLFDGFAPLIGDKSIQFSNGELGRKKHQLMSQSFTHNAVGNYYDCFVELSNEVANDWASQPSGQHIPLAEAMIAFGIKVATMCILGRHVADDEVKRLRTAYYVCWEELETQIKGSIPEEGDGRIEKFNEHRDIVRGIVRDSIKKRREEKNTDFLIVDSLSESDIIENEDEILDCTVSTLIASFHTTGNAMAWCLYYLAMNPDIQEKVYQEMKTVLGEETVTNEIISELTYTRQVIDETLRCSILAPWAGRIADYDLKVGEYVIPKQTPILIASGVVQKSEEIWPDPDRFDPDRFSPENSKARHPMAYQPFGFAGGRKCLGYRFAYAESFVLLSILVRRFKVNLVEGQVVKPHYTLVTGPTDEIWATVSER